MLCTRPLATIAQPRRVQGMTLIELMIGVSILAFLMMSGAPAFTDWIRNTQIRSAAESILTGLQLARTEAARYNTTARLQLTSSLDNGCQLTKAGRNWVVSLDASVSAGSHCGEKLSDTKPYAIRQRANLLSGTSPIVINASHTSVGFNGIGQRSDADAPDTAIFSVDITSTQGQCVKADGAGGSVRCLRVVVSQGGQAQLCDPGVADDQPNACH